MSSVMEEGVFQWIPNSLGKQGECCLSHKTVFLLTPTSGLGNMINFWPLLRSVFGIHKFIMHTVIFLQHCSTDAKKLGLESLI